MSFSRRLTYQKRANPNGDFCCTPQCAMSGKFNSAVSFHHFPRDENVKKVWIRNIRRENLVISRSTTVCSRHFVTSDVIQGGRRRLKEGAVPVLFAWNDYSLPVARPSVWERTQRPEDEQTEEEVDVTLALRCHDYHARPEPSALDLAQQKIETQQLEIEELRKKLEEVRQQPQVNAKWDQLGVALQGPLPVTHNGHRFILTVVDYYTKWVEAYPLKTDSATEVALNIRNLICQLGLPHRFLSQMERTFIGVVNHALGLYLALEDCSLMVFHPEACTLDPVTQSYINRMVSTLAKDHIRSWDLQLPASLFTLRCRIHPSTGKSPFFMLYSKKPRKVFSTTAQELLFSEGDAIKRILALPASIQEQSTDPSRVHIDESIPLQDQMDLRTVLCERCALWDGISQGSEGRSDRPLQGQKVDNTYTCAACRAETESVIIKQEEEDNKDKITLLSVENSLQLFLQHDLIQTVRIKEEIKEEPE